MRWTKSIPFQAESRADELSKTQISFKRALIRDIRDFSKDVTNFRADFVRNGPMVQVGCWLVRKRVENTFRRSEGDGGADGSAAKGSVMRVSEELTS